MMSSGSDLNDVKPSDLGCPGRTGNTNTKDPPSPTVFYIGLYCRGCRWAARKDDLLFYRVYFLSPNETRVIITVIISVDDGSEHCYTTKK